MAEVLIHGTIGGREEAIEQAMWASGEVTRVVLDNGNLDRGLREFSGSPEKPLVIIGPELPAVRGVTDYLRDDGYLVLGASKAGAQYEASKAKGVRLARSAGILHPPGIIAEGSSMQDLVRAYEEGHNPRHYVIKADGLAGGKGVVLPDTRQEARATLHGMMSGRLFDGAGSETILMQQRKKGAEVSALILVGAGKDDFEVLTLAQDHKRLQDGDKGPNTGGMGAYGPVPESIVSAAQYERIKEKAYASLAGMEAEGVTYEGAVLYMGLMMGEDLEGEDADDSYLIEYNVRLGDPEAQVVLALLQQVGVDVYRLFRSAAEGQIERPNVDFQNLGAAALTVCAAAEGYPNNPRTGDLVYGLDQVYEGVTIQMAGITRGDGPIRTNGGRVLYVTGVGETVDQAAEYAYAAIGQDAIHIEGMRQQTRSDIGWQAREAA